MTVSKEKFACLEIGFENQEYATIKAENVIRFSVFGLSKSIHKFGDKLRTYKRAETVFIELIPEANTADWGWTVCKTEPEYLFDRILTCKDILDVTYSTDGDIREECEEHNQIYVPWKDDRDAVDCFGCFDTNIYQKAWLSDTGILCILISEDATESIDDYILKDKLNSKEYLEYLRKEKMSKRHENS